ncbi:beta-ketoacyl-ACP synthase III [Clostridium estertheticum]|uniref:Beta-ketoacyl-[acyl-carrier-protein] synthase III n=2 Tax=Clostridium estertheticum TaxID=238834 RepID=A0A1J0GMH1_9CLOT|nr:beta-ketoacyl-ACP synthase III [Clostridium estertheticum]APC42463.1 3-oxoacyl-ACP synthase [Clostridium estertheticum subsp. estertheticum]MBU3075571.1 ketoacyl-ACP synthase III [Clostridium estertheticum]MBU3164847.1 ketoacyl-ACP synthase III [Clostridium estertheticum]MBU3174556.1 ketoacyl-ACP synthase III [Clostridium estertheticum]MBU3187872.1 ketoacyl-ACP synthase III [Clostridium estertheticum]
MNEVQIIGTGSYAPLNIMTNHELSKIVDTSDEWIVSMTGIKQRHISTGENTSDLATKAANEALVDANIKAEDIDLIIVASTSPDQFVPATACIVQGNIGAVNAMAFDISAACTGFIFALNIAMQFLKTGQRKRALIIGADVLSKIVDWTDRNTCILFGDGAGAAVLEAGSVRGIISVNSASEGQKGKFLTCPTVDVKNTYTKGNENFKATISMDGKEIFKFAVKTIASSISRILNENNYTLDDIKYVVCHQANFRIIEFVVRKLKADKDKFFVNLDKYGNTSAASIAIAMDEMNKENLLTAGDKIILVGFGGGLTYGASLIEWTMNK